MHKRGISTLIATVLIIGITISAFGIVYTFVMPLIKENIEANRLCGDVKVMINTQKGYTCYNSSNGQVNLQVSRGPDNINISSLQFKISGQGNSNTVDLMDGIKPVGLWHMDEGPGATTIIDSSGNGHTGAIIGSYWTDGKLGNALDFDGKFPIDHDYVIIPDAPSLDITNEITMSAWIKISDQTGIHQIVSKWDATGSYLMAVRGGDRYKYCYLNGVRNWYFQDATDVYDNQWHHIACTYNGVEIKFYVDGVNVQTSTGVSGSIIQNTYTLTISTSSAENFNGTIDEVAIWNKSLSPSDISNLYNSGNGQKSNLIEPNYLAGYWPLNEGSGISAVDSSGNGNTGTLRNFKSSVEYTSAGRFGGAYEFDGEKGYIEIKDSSSLLNISKSLTLGLWVNIYEIGLTDTYWLATKGKADPNWQYGILCTGDTQTCNFRIRNNIGTQFTTNSASIGFNKWEHLVGVYNSDTQKIGLYKDGVLFSQDNAPPEIGTTTESFFLSAGNPFNGTIDEVSIYDRALNSEEIKKLYGGYEIIDKVISPNGERTYVINAPSLDNIDSASVAPVVKVGNKEHVCSMTANVVLEAC